MHVRASYMHSYDLSMRISLHEPCEAHHTDSGKGCPRMKHTKQHNLTPDTKAGRSAGGYDAPKHTADHQNCPACIEANLQLIEIDSDISRLPFAEAAKRWMMLRRQSNLKDSTHADNEYYIRQLNKFFAAFRLCDITAGNLKSYQELRAANPVIGADKNGKELRNWKHKASNTIINHELCCLALIMQGKLRKGQVAPHGALWAKLKPFYFPKPTPKWSPSDVLSAEDEEEFFSIGASHPEAQLAYWVACITNNTTASGSELRFIRMKHVFLRERPDISEIYISEEGTKNDCRPRKIALNRTARWAVEQCYKRALQLGSCATDHFLFPKRCNRDKNPPLRTDGTRAKWDPTRPATKWFLRKSWDKLRAATGQKDMTPHKFRHQCITRLLENNVQPETVRSIAGHVTQQMMEYYSHIRAQAKYDAVMAIELDEIKKAKQGPRVIRKTA